MSACTLPVKRVERAYRPTFCCFVVVSLPVSFAVQILNKYIGSVPTLNALTHGPSDANVLHIIIICMCLCAAPYVRYLPIHSDNSRMSRTQKHELKKKKRKKKKKQRKRVANSKARRRPKNILLRSNNRFHTSFFSPLLLTSFHLFFLFVLLF